MLDHPRGRKLLAILRRHADRIVVLNPAMRDELIALDFPRERLVTLPCGADPEIFRPSTAMERSRLRARWQLAEHEAVIAFTGRFVEEKRLPDLIDAFALLSQHYPEATLVLAGDGALRDKLVMRAAAAGLSSRVRFTGMLPPERVAEVLALADIYVLPSESEGLPCSLIEAVACGLPSVVSDIPGTVLIQAGVTGFRIPVGDVESLAAALEALLRDPPLRDRMGRAARALFLEHYTIDRIRDGYERVYQELIGGKPAHV